VAHVCGRLRSSALLQVRPRAPDPVRGSLGRSAAQARALAAADARRSAGRLPP